MILQFSGGISDLYLNEGITGTEITLPCPAYDGSAPGGVHQAEGNVAAEIVLDLLPEEEADGGEAEEEEED